MQTFPIFHLTSLDSEHCWSLLAEHAFGANNSSERSKLEELGREIVKKCDGLPLAAVVLGGLLRTKLSKNDWSKRILQQTVCYHKRFSWTISVAWGYAVQVYQHPMLLTDVLRVQGTFKHWSGGDVLSPLYTFNTRGFHPHPCCSKLFVNHACEVVGNLL
ncbi:hypothetical protein AHAS_Ahas10G0202900 [Arachis hypogaea]